MAVDFWLIARILVFPGFTFILLLTLFCDWVERKLEARLQNRVGPMVAGPGGLFQPVADFIKLQLKKKLNRESKENRLQVCSSCGLRNDGFCDVFLAC